MPHNASEVSVERRDCHLNCLARTGACHLVAQMIGCHNAAMECFHRAMISEQTFAGRQQNLSFANKLSRTFALHMEALDKHRGKGRQTVRVEHVSVNAGGQAIVGSVQGGAGVSQKSEDQAHAELTHAPEQEVRTALEAEREAVPQASIPNRHSRAPGRRGVAASCWPVASSNGRKAGVADEQPFAFAVLNLACPGACVRKCYAALANSAGADGRPTYRGCDFSRV
jgi:hypothetical protein